MLLTCPKCRSGLQVPDGTTALVRCPACKNVFAPADGHTPPEPEEDEDAPKPRAKPKVRTRGDDEDEKPKARQKPAAKEKDEKPKEQNRDFDPIPEEEDRKRKKKRRRSDDDDDESLSPEEKAKLRREFGRAALGVRLVWISMALFMFSMVLVLFFYFTGGLGKDIEPIPVFVTLAGGVGLLSWLVGAAGVGLCLSGPRSPGHLGYGIAAASAVGIHLIFLLVIVAQGKELAIGKYDETDGNNRWGLIPTRLNATMFYLTAVIYPDTQGITPKGSMTVSMIVGVVEMVRIVLIMMLLSCLARAAGDDELSHRCTRAAGVASFGPGILALLIFGFVAAMVETGAGGNLFAQIIFMTVHMGVYAIICGTLFPSFMAAREVADACDEPFQSKLPQL